MDRSKEEWASARKKAKDLKHKHSLSRFPASLSRADSLVVGLLLSIQIVKKTLKMAKYLPSQSSQAFDPVAAAERLFDLQGDN